MTDRPFCRSLRLSHREKTATPVRVPVQKSSPRPRLRGGGLALTAALAFALPQGTAHAGGFEVPANGTEALGRAGAFVAKADSPLAIEYNVAGLAQQRGTRVVFDNNLYLSRYAFQRAGSDGFGPYPEVADQSGAFYAPWFALSTDFGYFDRVTFAVGVFGPSSVGHRTYPLFMSGMDGSTRPGAGRYDVLSTDLLIFFPTAAVAFRPHPIVDIGIAVQQATAMFSLASATYVPTSVPIYPDSAACSKQSDAPACDSITRIEVKSYDNFALLFGLLLHPGENTHIGLSVRSAVNLGLRPVEAKGTVSAAEPAALVGSALGADRMDGLFTTTLPWMFRLGLRRAFGSPARESGDIELDAVYEAWSWNGGSDNHLTLLNPPPLVNRGMPLTLRLPHNYHDVLSLRLGGAYNHRLTRASELTVRAGMFFETGASSDKDIRLDFDTLAKVGGAVGLGIGVRGVTLNIGYSFQQSLSRNVTEGGLYSLDGTTGQPLQIDGQQAAAINTGRFEGRTHVVSAGLSVVFDALVRGPGWLERRRTKGKKS